MSEGRSLPASSSASSTTSAASTTLASVALRTRVRVTATRLDADQAAWIAAVGISSGEEVEVLRRAALGGPLHVRTASGGEFAVAREIATCIDVVEVST
jgi:ferrous iron transport protein A